MDFDDMKKDKDFQKWCFNTELVGNKNWFNLESGSGDEVYIAYEAWVASQQRKQAEIDALKDCITNLVKQKNKANAKLDNIQEIIELKTSGSFTSVLRKIDAISEELLK